MEFLEIVSGRRRGLKAALCRVGLACLEPGYAAVISWRNRRFNRNTATVQRVSVPVVSVGNLTAGGTGKTPMVAWLARWFRERGLRVTLISRGYGAAAGARNDEALELEELLPDVPHLLNPDRVSAALTAIEEFECQLLILDDAFQHRRIHRDLDIVLVDATEPFGYGHLLPRGLLREPISSLSRAHVIGLSRSDLVSADTRLRIRAALERHAGPAPILEIAQIPCGWLSWPDRRIELGVLVGSRLAAFCGIGNPEGFRQTLLKNGCQLAGFRALPDHHPYDRSDLDSLAQWARSSSAEALVCTQKDLVKIRASQLDSVPLYSLSVGVSVSSGLQQLEPLLADVARRASASRSPSSGALRSFRL
jgi:tetraacyldisaccharide 4'-kinase